MQQLRFFVALFSLCLAKCLASDYCNMTECAGLQHLGCNNSLIFHSSCLRTHILINMQMYQEYLVKIHNKYREDVAAGSIMGLAKARQMPELMWHSELALIAEYHVKRCLRKLSKYCVAVANFTDPSVNYGLNWLNIRKNYRPSTHSDQLAIQAEQWLHQVYKLAQGDRYGDAVYEIRNILNNDNQYMGCAAAEDYDRTSSRFVLICYYDQQYDWDNPIYHNGTFAAENCRLGRSDNYAHLCKVEPEPDW